MFGRTLRWALGWGRRGGFFFRWDWFLVSDARLGGLQGRRWHSSSSNDSTVAAI